MPVSSAAFAPHLFGGQGMMAAVFDFMKPYDELDGHLLIFSKAPHFA
jgi:hypothetical protein